MKFQLLLTVDNKTQKVDIDNLQIQKMLFIHNALEDGWKVEKDKKTYLFKRPHEEKREYFTDEYLAEFIKKYFQI